MKSRRGPGIESGLDILKKVRDKIDVPVLTDVHSEQQIKLASESVDIANPALSAAPPYTLDNVSEIDSALN